MAEHHFLNSACQPLPALTPRWPRLIPTVNSPGAGTPETPQCSCASPGLSLQTPPGLLSPGDSRWLLGPQAIAGRSCSPRPCSQGPSPSSGSGHTAELEPVRSFLRTSTPPHSLPGGPHLRLPGVGPQASSPPIPLLCPLWKRREDR